VLREAFSPPGHSSREGRGIGEMEVVNFLFLFFFPARAGYGRGIVE